MTLPYVRVTRGKHRGAIGKLRATGPFFDNHKCGRFAIVQFPTGDCSEYYYSKRPSWIVFPKTSQKIAAKMFKFAQRKP